MRSPVMETTTRERDETPTDRELDRLRRHVERANRLLRLRAARYREALIARFGPEAVWVRPTRGREAIH